MVQVLHRDLLQAYGRGSTVGVETRVDNELAEVGRFLEGDRGGGVW